MKNPDKIDVAEALEEVLDETEIAGLGWVTVGQAEDGVLVLETWPNGNDKPSVDFLLRITRYRQNPHRGDN